MSGSDELIRFGVLGPLLIRPGDQPVDVGGAKQRATLAMLITRHNELVRVERIIDELWPRDPPASAVANVRTYVSNIRRCLGPLKGRLATRTGGYLLRLEEGELDTAVFERAECRAVAALRAGDAETALAEYRRALMLWRGAPLEDVPTGPALELDAAALTEAHLRAREGHFDAESRSGDVAGTVRGLRQLLAEHPQRESAWVLLIRAHHAAGERAAALNTYQQARSALANSLGLDPGPELQELHAEILSGAVRPSHGPFGGKSIPASPVPRQLPLAPATLVGREEELARLRAALTRPASDRTVDQDGEGPRIIGIHGLGGAGKSGLAVAAAQTSASAYPDGQLYVDLQGTSPGLPPLDPGEVLGRFLRALHVPEERISPDTGEAASWFRSCTAGRRILILLDNAVDYEQVRPLLPAGRGCAVLITSRGELTTLDRIDRLALGQLSVDSAVELLRRLIGAELIDEEIDAARLIVGLCGLLPLAVRVIGIRFAQIPGWRLPYVAQRLRSDRSRLDELGLEDLDVRSTFDIGYRALLAAGHEGQSAARLFRRLGVLRFSEITPFAAAALVDTDEMTAFRLLSALVRHGLLERAQTLFRMHDLLRLFATERARDEEEPAALSLSLSRVARHYIELIHSNPVLRLPRAGDPAAEEAPGPRTVAEGVAWVTAHLAPLGALVRQLAESPTQLPLAYDLLHSLHRRLVVFHPAECIRLYGPVLAGAKRDGDDALAAEALCILSNAHLSLHRYEDMAACAHAALRALPRIDDDHVRARVLGVVASVEIYSGEPLRAIGRLSEVVAIHERDERWKAVGVNIHEVARAEFLRGDYDTSLRMLQRSLALSRSCNDLLDTSQVHDSLAKVSLRADRPAAAVAHADAALNIVERTGHEMWQARALQWRSLAKYAQGRCGEAIADAERAAWLCRNAEIPLLKLDALRSLGTVLWLCGDERAAGVLAEADAFAASPGSS